MESSNLGQPMVNVALPTAQALRTSLSRPENKLESPVNGSWRKRLALTIVDLAGLAIADSVAPRVG